MAEAIRALLEEGRRDLAFLGVVGEETDSPGAKQALELKDALGAVEAVVNGEPTGNRLATGQKGAVHLRLRCRGKAAHSGTPEEGVNAAFPLLDWIAAVRALPLAEDPRLGPEVWNLGTLTAGRAINVVPDEGTADSGTLPPVETAAEADIKPGDLGLRRDGQREPGRDERRSEQNLPKFHRR